jgi:hypothetical protein
MSKLARSKYVKMIKDEFDEGITISAQSIDDNSRYIIEFNSKRELDMILHHPSRDLDGFYANIDNRYDENTGKAYLDITFKPFPHSAYMSFGKNAKPNFTLNLMNKDIQIAQKVYAQLNTQALEMERVQELSYLR